MALMVAAVRLAKYLAHAGVASRRASEQLVFAGRVTVGDEVVRDPARDVDGSIPVAVDGRHVRVSNGQRAVYAVHKPRGVVSTARDPQGRPTIVSLVPSQRRLYPVGRLDAASEGLLLLTNDGELAQRLLHPSFEVPRTYRVSVEGRVAAPALRQLASGVEIEGGLARAREVRLLEQADARSVVELVVVEGRKHQIREMLRAVGHPVRRLLRVRFGPLTLQGLAPGASRPLRPAERDALLRMLTPESSERQPRRASPAPRTQENPRKIK